MMSKALSISAAVLALASPAAIAAGVTERMQIDRMTVVRVDRGSAHSCAPSTGDGSRSSWRDRA
jgi:hypothetical protein